MGHIPIETLKSRQSKLIDAIQNSEFDALVLNPSPSLTYLTGMEYHLSERPTTMIFSPNHTPVIVLPELEGAKTIDLGYPIEVITYGEEPSEWIDSFKKAANYLNLGTSKLGIEERNFRYMEIEIYKQAFPSSTLENASDMVASIRMQKDTSEIESIQRAVDIAQEALQATLPLIKIGMTEKEIATEIIMQLYRHGSDPTLPFSPIVASGPNSANPHAFPTDRKLAGGELVVIDWGCSINGYFSDLTRTFAIGHATPEQERIHATVHLANQAGHAATKPGVTCGSVDDATRAIIEEAGYGEFFTHRTGHGLGMEGHEPPFIRANNEMVLKENMSFTIEPGVYIPQKDGVRIEDDVIVTTNGIHSFSTMQREIQVIG